MAENYKPVGDDALDIGVCGGPWDEGRDELFISLLEEEKSRLRNMFRGRFTKTSLNKIRVELSGQTGYDYTYDQVKNKWTHLKTKHGAFLQLAQSTGVVPNYETGQIYAEDHHWDKLEKLHRQGKAIRLKGFPHFLRISALVADSRAKGKNVHASTKSPSGTDSSDDRRPVTIKKEKLDNVNVLSDDDEGFLLDQFKGKGKEKVAEGFNKIMVLGKSSGGSRSGSGKKRDSYSADLCHSISEIAASAKKRASLAEQRTVVNQQKTGVPIVTNLELDNRMIENTMMDECMDILNKLDSEGRLDDKTYNRAVGVLTDPVKVRLLLKVPHDKWPSVIHSFYPGA